MNSKRILLVDPQSITHGPPQVIKAQDRALTVVYSQSLDSAINKKIGTSSFKHNSNAVSNHYISNYGLLMLGQVFKKGGFDVEYINGDYYCDKNDFFSAIVHKAEFCQSVCFTATTPQYQDIVNVAYKLAELFPQKLLVFGGPHAYFFQFHNEKNPFHLICVGHDIEKAGKKIMEFTQNMTFPANTLICSVFGYTDCEKDFSLIPNKYLKNTLLYSYVSFGCPNKCHYCIEHYFTKKICSLILEDKLKEIDFLTNKADVNLVHLADSDFFINSHLASRFIRMLEEQHFNCCFTVNTSPNVITKKETIPLIKKFVQNGLIEILIGVEYFSEDELAKMNKKYNISDFFYSLSEIKENFPELIISFYSLLGLPGETPKTIEENIKWTSRFREANLFDFSFPKFFVPYPGTDIFEYPEKYMTEIIHKRWEEYHRWSSQRPIRIKGLSEEIFINELSELYNICNITIN